MIISTRGRYALRLMLDLAEHDNGEYLALRDISGRQDLSQKYMEQILPALSASRLLLVKSGRYGGYRLAKKADDYSLGEILRAAEGSLAPVACLEGIENPCARQADCATLPVWTELDRIINDYLDGITLQDLVNQQAARHNKENGNSGQPGNPEHSEHSGHSGPYELSEQPKQSEHS